MLLKQTQEVQENLSKQFYMLQFLISVSASKMLRGCFVFRLNQQISVDHSTR